MGLNPLASRSVTRAAAARQLAAARTCPVRRAFPRVRSAGLCLPRRMRIAQGAAAFIIITRSGSSSGLPVVAGRVQ